MKKDTIESYVLVIVQFLCMLFFIFFVGSAPLTVFHVVIVACGIAFALWAIITMRFGNIRVNPIPKETARLVTSGPYSQVRHPMYAAVLLMTLGFALNIGTILGYGVWVLLLIDLIVKMRFEERLLSEKFSEYAEYMKQTKRLLPKIW